MKILSIGVILVFCMTYLAEGVMKPEVVSLVRIIANPELYDGKQVVTQGYLDRRFEESYLYVGKEDWANGIYLNALWVEESENFVGSFGGYRFVTGVFRAGRPPHVRSLSGILEVSRAREIPTEDRQKTAAQESEEGSK